ncbi:MAG: hypothetical protein KAS84_02895 [Anaerolineales bacterium]|nr:hypothetical protein [Anaerolineales bacterium]
MNLLDNSLLVWVVIAVVGLFILRVILKVTKKILTLGIMICLAVAVYLLISKYLFPSAAVLP